MGKQERLTRDNSSNRGSWAVLLLALAYIIGAILAMNRTYQQPSGGWLFEDDGESYAAVAPLIDNANNFLQSGDQLLAEAGMPISTEIVLRPMVWLFCCKVYSIW